MFADRLAN